MIENMCEKCKYFYEYLKKHYCNNKGGFYYSQAIDPDDTCPDFEEIEMEK